MTARVSVGGSDRSRLLVATRSGADRSRLLIATRSGADRSRLLIATRSGADRSRLLVATRSGADRSRLLVATRSGADRSRLLVATRSGADRSRLLVATRSAHKLRELRQLLGPLRAELVSLDDAGIPGEAIEDGETFAANAAKKARFFAAVSGLPTLADDSGLEVDALGGGPGVRTRRYAGESATDEDNNVKLLGELAGLGPERRAARYRCALALALPEATGPRGGIPVRISHGTLEGRIAASPRGYGGFGYDPIFEPAGEPPGGRTLGVWTAEAKNRISHRGRAARRMHSILTSLGF